MASLVDLVRSFRGIRALVMGDAMLDSYLEGTATRLCSEGPVPVVRKRTEDHAPGGASNTAANLRAMGADVIFLGLIGRDSAGRALRAVLQERGVDDRWLVEDESVSTLHKQRILADDQYVVRFDAGDTTSPSPASRAELEARLAEAFPRCDLVVISDYRYGLVGDDLLARLCALRAARPCVLAIDSKDLHRFRRAGATVVTPNYLEARLAVDPTSGDEASPDPAAVEPIGRRLLETVNAEMAAITLAADGVLLLDRAGSALHLPAHPVAHPNDVGAGDSFTAAMALALAAGGTGQQAARIAIDAGGIAVTQRRTAVVHYQELLQRVSREDGAVPPTAAALARRLAGEQQRGKVVVFTNGVFDILHAGHVRFLREARQLGDVLVVGVNSDRSARRLKGKNRPINSERDRLALVAALDPVDHVVLFDEDTPAELIRSLRPNIHVKGGDYQGEALPEADAVREVGGDVVILPLAEAARSRPYSTSDVIDRILELALDGAGKGAP